MYDYVLRPENADGTILMWEVEPDIKVYGLAEHYGNEVTFNSYYELLIHYPYDFKAEVFSAEQLGRWKLSDGVNAVKGRLIVELLQVIFRAVKGPVEVNSLADVIAQMTGSPAAGRTVNDGRDENEDLGLSQDKGPVTEASPYADRLGAETLPLVWKEICSFHLTQRRAHFLKKDYEDVILFIANGISSRQMADALEIPLLQFEELLNNLPLSNHEIAALFSANPTAIGNAATKVKKSIRAKFAGFFGISKEPANEKGNA